MSGLNVPSSLMVLWVSKYGTWAVLVQGRAVALILGSPRIISVAVISMGAE